MIFPFLQSQSFFIQFVYIRGIHFFFSNKTFMLSW